MNVLNQASGDNFVAYHGDSAEVLQGLPESSIDMSVYSPPFADLFVYSNSERDLGNSRNWPEFFKQKTAYEIRIRDWSSDVCSSDLGSSG